MVQDEKTTDSKLVGDDLEPYRRLVDLQKQMIELVRQHERTKVECAELRDQLLNEMAKRNPRSDLRRFISRLATKLSGKEFFGHVAPPPGRPPSDQRLYSFLLLKS